MEYTPNIHLSQIEANDKPTWLSMYNGDMRNIDSAVGKLQSTSSTVSQVLIPEIMKSVEDLQKVVTDNTTNIGINTTSISALKLEIANTQADLDTLDKREQAHYDALSATADADKDAIKALQDGQTVLQANMVTVRTLVGNAATSINKLQPVVYQNAADIKELQNKGSDIDAEIANLKAETDTLETSLRQESANIDKLQSQMAAATASINKNQSALAELPAIKQDIAALETDVNQLQTDYNNATGDIAAAQADITALEKKTANMSDGITLNTSITLGSDGVLSYDNNGTSVPIGTKADITGLINQLTQLQNDLAAEEAKTANITAGKSLPYSLGIAEGGAYGYIPNGEVGVVPFIKREDIGSIVDIAPIEAKVANIQGSPSIASDTVITSSKFANGRMDISPLGTASPKVILGDMTSGGGSQTIEIPFGFGIDSNGNYGYKKVGADTVTPFLSPITANTASQSQYGLAGNPSTYYYITIDKNYLLLLPYSSYSQVSVSSVITGGASAGATEMDISSYLTPYVKGTNPIFDNYLNIFTTWTGYIYSGSYESITRIYVNRVFCRNIVVAKNGRFQII